jgi:dihydrolipoamide dehydrogenase
MTTHYDVAIIGAGPGGYTAALRAAQRGASVVLIDAAQPGGTCLNAGCIPTKALLHAGEIARSAVAGLRKGVGQLLKARNVTCLTGRATLTGPGAIRVATDDGETVIEATSIILATGASPVRPAWAPWESPRVWTTDEATTAEALPESIIIIGGGVIGCELATAYAELDVETHLVELEPTLLPGIDTDISKIITRSLKKRKVALHLGSGVSAITADDESASVTLASGEVLVAANVLVAVGRQPTIDGLGLESLGVAIADGRLVVDEQCRTSVEGIYAVGDLASPKQYAHVAARMGIIAATNATGGEASDDLSLVPECIYTHPEAASVGWVDGSVEGIACRHVPISACGLAQAYGQMDGTVKLFVDEASGAICGGVIIAPHATELISTVTLAIRQSLSVEAFAELIWPHPTFAESLGEAAEAYLGYPLHVLD